MAEVLYTSVVWTAGDIITEAKMDNMVANDRAVDAMANGVQFTERADPDTPSANNVHLYAKDKSGTPTLYAINDAGDIYEISENTPVFTFPFSGPLYTTTNATNSLIVHKALEIVKAYAYVRTAPTGQSIIIDINKGGTSLWASTQANRLTITAGNQSDDQTSFDTTQLAEGDVLVIDIDQVGSGTSGSDLTVELKCK